MESRVLCKPGGPSPTEGVHTAHCMVVSLWHNHGWAADQRIIAPIMQESKEINGGIR